MPVNNIIGELRHADGPPCRLPRVLTDEELPAITVARTTWRHDLSGLSVSTPSAVYAEFDPVNMTAPSLYRVTAKISKFGPHVLDLHRHIIADIAWFHSWSDDREALAAVNMAADLLEEYGWLLRTTQADGVELWTPLGRDRPRLDRGLGQDPGQQTA